MKCASKKGFIPLVYLSLIVNIPGLFSRKKLMFLWTYRSTQGKKDSMYLNQAMKQFHNDNPSELWKKTHQSALIIENVETTKCL